MPFQPGTPVTAAEAAANWQMYATQKSAKWVARTLKPKVLFTTAAIAQAQTWMNRLIEVGTAGFIAGMNRAQGNLDKIALNIQNNGAASYSSGINAKAYKYQSAINGLLPQIQAIAASLPPRGDAAANDNRMNLMVSKMRALRGLYRG